MRSFSPLFGALAACAVLLSAPVALAQDYPSKAVTIVHGLAVAGMPTPTQRNTQRNAQEGSYLGEDFAFSCRC